MSMDEDELDTIRRRKMAELQQAQVQAQAEQQYRDQQQAQRQQILRQILTPEARERLGRIDPAYPERKVYTRKQLRGLTPSAPPPPRVHRPDLGRVLERDIPRYPPIQTR